MGGHPVDYLQESAPVQYLQPATPQPSVFSCSPEIFAKLAQGGTLTPEELQSLTGAGALATTEGTQKTPISQEDAPADAGNSASESADKVKSKKKSLSSKKKKSKSCC